MTQKRTGDYGEMHWISIIENKIMSLFKIDDGIKINIEYYFGRRTFMIDTGENKNF